MVSSVRGALRTVHADSPAAGRRKIESKLNPWLKGAGSDNPGLRASATAAANYIQVVDQCADWHESSTLKYELWQLRGAVRYSSTDGVDVLVRVVLQDPGTKHWGRVILWDTVPLNAAAARVVAAPVIEILDQEYGRRAVGGVEVWHGRTGRKFRVPADRARAARPAAVTLVSG
jgi:hypothetical protein